MKPPEKSLERPKAVETVSRPDTLATEVEVVNSATMARDRVISAPGQAAVRQARELTTDPATIARVEQVTASYSDRAAALLSQFRRKVSDIFRPKGTVAEATQPAMVEIVEPESSAELAAVADTFFAEPAGDGSSLAEVVLKKAPNNLVDNVGSMPSLRQQLDRLNDPAELTHVTELINAASPEGYDPATKELEIKMMRTLAESLTDDRMNSLSPIEILRSTKQYAQAIEAGKAVALHDAAPLAIHPLIDTWQTTEQKFKQGDPTTGIATAKALAAGIGDVSQRHLNINAATGAVDRLLSAAHRESNPKQQRVLLEQASSEMNSWFIAGPLKMMAEAFRGTNLFGRKLSMTKRFLQGIEGSALFFADAAGIDLAKLYADSKTAGTTEKIIPGLLNRSAAFIRLAGKSKDDWTPIRSTAQTLLRYPRVSKVAAYGLKKIVSKRISQ